MECSTKPIQRYPPRLMHVATLRLEIKKFKLPANIQQMWKKMQTNCILRNYPPSKFVCQLLCCVPLQKQTF